MYTVTFDRIHEVSQTGNPVTTPFARIFIPLLCTGLSLFLTACNKSEPLEQQIVLTNGHVYSMAWGDPDLDGVPSPDAPFENGIWYPDAEAIYISGDEILYVGTNEGALAQAHSSAEIIDVAGAVVIPRAASIGQNDVNLFDRLFSAITSYEENGNPDRNEDGKRKKTPEEALRMYTVWAVNRASAEASASSLVAGNRANLTVLSVDPLNVLLPGEEGIGIPVSELLDGQIEMTMIEGTIVHNRVILLQ